MTDQDTPYLDRHPVLQTRTMGRLVYPPPTPVEGIGYLPPAELEQSYYQRSEESTMVA